MAVIVSGKIHAKTAELLNLYFGNDFRGKIKNEEHLKLLSRCEATKKIHINKSGTVQCGRKNRFATINKRTSGLSRTEDP